MLPVGRFGRVYGVAGWLWVYPLSGGAADRLISYRSWYLRASASPIGTGDLPADTSPGYSLLQLAERHLVSNNRLRVKLTNCSTPESARIYTNAVIYVPQTALPPLAGDEYYCYQLVGMTVVGLDGKLGVVREIRSVGAHDLLVVQGARRRLLVPYVERIILAVDLARQRIQVAWASDYL